MPFILLIYPMINAIVISDTHLQSVAGLDEGLLNLITSSDVVIHAGDFDTYNFISELQKNSKELYAVSGNCDDKNPFPQKLVFELEGLKIGLCHGAGRKENIIERLHYIFYDESLDIIIFGHTHIPLIEKIGKTTFINPGSPNRNRNITYGTYCDIKINNGSFVARIMRMDGL